MKNLFVKIMILSFLVALCSLGLRKNGKTGNTAGIMKLSNANATLTGKSGKVGDAYAFMANKVLIPMDNKGILGDVSIDGLTRGEYDGNGFLFSGGFMISGKADTGSGGATGQELWASAMASASRIEDYVPGPWNKQNDPNAQVYVVLSSEPPFGQSWQDWKSAVALGADFYDGDGDGVYNPVDKDADGKWDKDEDKPDMPGDVTAWCVYSDGRPTSQRGLTGQSPHGIEIHQTLFGFDAAGPLGSMVFLRYRVFSRDTVNYSGDMDSVIFGVWADPDIGTYTDDMVGCDTIRSAGYGYSNGFDNSYGVNPPCYMVDFFQGPVVYEPGVSFTDVNFNGIYDAGIDIPLKTGIEVFGLDKGMKSYLGAMNLGLSSFVNYVQSDPVRGDPNLATEARNYMRGLLKDGTKIKPAEDSYGTGGLENMNPYFWYSGDPVKRTGWLYNKPGDIRMMSNVGPFKLKKNTPVDIVVALIVGRGSDSKNSITIARAYSDIAQVIYDGNFRTPPPSPLVSPITVRTTDKEIYLTWETKKQANFRDQVYTDSTNTKLVWDMRFEGYEVTAYQNPVTAPEINGVANSKVIARYDMENNIGSVYTEGLDGSRSRLFEAGTPLDTTIFGSDSGRLTLKIDTDPFTGTPLIKGKAYYFSITGHSLNLPDLLSPRQWLDTNRTDVGDYLFPRTALFTYSANNPQIISWGDPSEVGIRPGTYIWDPFQMTSADPGNNYSDVKVSFEEVYKDQLTGDNYTVNFFKNTKANKYQMFWKLTNSTTGIMLLDSQRVYDMDNTVVPTLSYTGVVEGFRVKVDSIEPNVKPAIYSGQKWFEDFARPKTGAMYTGSDIVDSTKLTGIGMSYFNNYIKADKLRQVEIRFGQTQKAYRYTTNNLGSQIAYAPLYTRSGVTASGFVDVPFQVWEKDPKLGTERQLAAGFLEKGNLQDGIWNPGTNIGTSYELIFVFDSPYTQDSLVRYTGGIFNSATQWATPKTGWTKPSAWPSSIMTTQDSIIARSPLFDILYAVGLERKVNVDTVWWGNRDSVNHINRDTLFYHAGDILTIPVIYPILPTDTYTFKTRKLGEGLTDAEKQATWRKVNVFPNPLFAFNPGGSYIGRASDDPYVTFSNLPPMVTVRIFTLSGANIRTLTQEDKRTGRNSPFLEWDLKNSSGLRVASGMYIALVTSPGYDEKVLKFAVIMPQKQIQNY